MHAHTQTGYSSTRAGREALTTTHYCTTMGRRRLSMNATHSQPAAVPWPAQTANLPGVAWQQCCTTHATASCRCYQPGDVVTTADFRVKLPNLSADGQFQPRLLTHHIQQAWRVEYLQQLWLQHQNNFNDIHISALMQQLAVLHQAATAALGQEQQAWPIGVHSIGDNQTNAAAGSRFSTAGSQTAEVAVSGSDSSVNGSSRNDDHEAASFQLQHNVRQPVRPPLFNRKEWEQHKRNRQLQLSKQLAQAVAAAALQPSRVLDGRAVVMISHSLAKIGLQDVQLLSRIVQVTSAPQLLQQLDAQQLTNLVWSVAVCADAANGLVGPSMGQHSSNHRSKTDHITPGSSSTSSSSSPVLPSHASVSRYVLPGDWLLNVAQAFIDKLPKCSSSGVAMAVWGFAQLGLKPGKIWLKAFFRNTAKKLAEFPPRDLAVLAYALGRLQVELPSSWLGFYLAASTETLASLSTQELSMSLWGLASCNAAPHKAWLMAWFLCTRANMDKASAQDLSIWMYSLALLHITPSPLWCTSFVEASYDKLTATSTPPQELVNVMWAISCLDWSPPMLYWKGLLKAAQAKFSNFNPLDLANCISAATAVDVSSIERPWLAAFIQASEPKLPSFQPVHLAHTVTALAVASKSHQWASVVIHAAWQEKFVQAAAQQLALRRFKMRPLELVVKGLKQIYFRPASTQVAEFLQRADALLEHMQRVKQQTQETPR